MGAYNILKNLETDCPVCDFRSVEDIQIKTASSPGGKNEVQFAYKLYNFGDKMLWWSRSDPSYAEWREGGNEKIGPDAVNEWISLRCDNCLSQLRVVVSFESLYIVGVSDVSVEPAPK